MNQAINDLLTIAEVPTPISPYELVRYWSSHGNTVLRIDDAMLEALRNGQVLAHNDGEYGLILVYSNEDLRNGH